MARCRARLRRRGELRECRGPILFGAAQGAHLGLGDVLCQACLSAGTCCAHRWSAERKCPLPIGDGSRRPSACEKLRQPANVDPFLGEPPLQACGGATPKILPSSLFVLPNKRCGIVGPPATVRFFDASANFFLDCQVQFWIFHVRRRFHFNKGVAATSMPPDASQKHAEAREALTQNHKSTDMQIAPAGFLREAETFLLF